MLEKALQRLPLTKLKITLAKVLYAATVLVFGKKKRVIERDGIRYEVDLSEGIDLSLFLFGAFQKHITANRYSRIPEDAVIIDVGANFGIMSLRFAKAAPRGTVYAFEPTHFALSRLRTNLGLNPELAARIHVTNAFVSDSNTDEARITAFASWKVGGSRESNEALHPMHWGSAKSTAGAGAVTLDEFTAKNSVQRIDLIKIDTDGHEFEVLRGAKETLRRTRSNVIFEVGGYMMKEKGIDFGFYLGYFGELGYRLFDAPTGREVLASTMDELIPLNGTTDVIAVPADRVQA